MIVVENGDHLGLFSFHEACNVRIDQRPIGVKRIGEGFGSDVIEYLGKVGPKHRLTAGDGPLPAPHASGLVHDSGYLIEAQFISFLGGDGRNTYPAMSTGVVAAIGEVSASFKREARSVLDCDPFAIILHGA
jgi:hypothetical protein